MKMQRLVAATSCAAVLLGAPAALSATRFRNCTQLNKKYPHGVGRPGAHDKTAGEKVTNFRVNRAVYNQNKGKDRDHDGIACEKL